MQKAEPVLEAAQQDLQDIIEFLPVIDNGKGLKGADSGKIFGVFQRHETSRGSEGAGLSLAIVKEIAEQHAGRVWVEPAAKGGTTFSVSISKDLPFSGALLSGS